MVLKHFYKFIWPLCYLSMYLQHSHLESASISAFVTESAHTKLTFRPILSNTSSSVFGLDVLHRP